jgi:PAS domain S-box-containing protein
MENTGKKTGSLDRALAETGDGAFVIDRNARIISWNRAAERMLGYPAREVMGRRCCEILVGRDEHDNRLCHHDCHVRTLVKLGDPVQNFDMHATTKAGDPVWLNVSVLSMPPVVVHLFRDITAQRQLLSLLRERLSTASPALEAPGIHEMLTRREIEILKLVAGGVNTRGVAQRLHVSPATVRNHLQNVFGKLGVHSRLEAVTVAMRRRWL